MPCASIVGLLFVLWPVVAQATVYSWRGEGGVLMMSNDPQDVPEDKRASVQTFTSKPAPKAAPEEEEVPYPPREESARFNAYQRGFEHGLEAAEREAAFAERLALAALAAVPQVPPAPIVIEQPTPPIMPYTASPYDDYGPAFYGLYAPYPPSYAYGFGRPFVSHRRFFPGTRGRPFGPLFGRRHTWFSRAVTGRMR